MCRSTTGVVRRKGGVAHVGCGSSLILAHFIAVLESNHGLTCGCHCWLVQQCDSIQKKLFENDDRKHCWASQQWHPLPDVSWWDRLPACLLGMTGKMPVATKSFSFSAITFENRYMLVEKCFQVPGCDIGRVAPVGAVRIKCLARHAQPIDISRRLLPNV